MVEYLKLFKITFTVLCMGEGTCTCHIVYVQVRGQLAGNLFSLSTMWALGLNSGHQSWWHAPYWMS